MLFAPCPHPNAALETHNVFARFRWLFAFSASLVLFAGCRGQSTRADKTQRLAASSDKIFNAVHSVEPKHLDPAYVYDFYEQAISGYLYDGLVNFGKGSDVQPGLAESWGVSPDGKTYTFHLRPAKFSNGQPVRSADVRYSFTRVLRPETNSERKWIFDRVVGAKELAAGKAKELEGLKTPDEKTVVMTLDSPYPAFLTKLAMPNAVIIPDGSAGATAPDKQFDSHPVGSGPWALTDWVRDQRLEFRRNEHYWGNKPKFERLVDHIQLDDNVARRQFEVGNFDSYMVGFPVYRQWVRVPEKKARMKPLQELCTYYLGFMNSKPKFADKRVRQAISCAIDTKSIFENLQLGRGVLAHGPIPPGVAGYRPELAARAYDPDKARRLLAEAKAQNLTIDLWFSDEALTQEMMQAVKNDLSKVGIKVNLVQRDLAALRQAVYQGEPDMFNLSWWLDYPDIENALVPTFSSKTIPYGGNATRFSSPEFDRLVAEADQEPDPQKRIAKYQKAEDLVMEECPWVFFFHRKSFTVVQPWVTGYEPSLMLNAERLTDIDIDLTKKSL